MQAFKAANPHATLEDFVRWHSPRDWIQPKDEQDGSLGRLSARMADSSNIWQELWKVKKKEYFLKSYLGLFKVIFYD